MTPSKAERLKAAMAERDEAYRAWGEALQAWTEACRRAQLIEDEQ